MQKKWLLLAGLVAIVIPVITFMGCSAGSSLGTNGGSPLEINLNNQQEGIWVNGQGKVTATPDIANVSLGIEAQAATVSEAQAKAASAMDRVMDALSNNGVAKKDIKTQYFNISKVTRWDDNNRQEVVLGYRVTNTVTAKIRDIEKTGTLIDDTATAGGDLTRINNIYFSIDDPAPYQEEARDKAMADAKNKAEQLADLSGVKLGKPTYISENLYYPPPIYRDVGMMEGAPAPAPTTPISPGETEVTLNVQVVYAILN
ncbi:SIMPL domain-containing protein [Chloroflexota bacterium]